MTASSIIGTTISHYRIVSPLGAGGMGEVYLAEDTQLGRQVAIKLLPPETISDEHARKRLVREARAAATLDHPNICAIHEVGEEEGRSFIVMQYVEGETLDLKVKRKPLELKESLTIASQIAGALSEAHAHGIIHRDIKPSNIIITPRGQAKVMDFGLARVIPGAVESEAQTQSLLTTPGTILGTMPYMSPEQMRGEALDARSDIFSFGVVLYEMLSGRQPFASESDVATVSAILTHEPPPLARFTSAAPAELERIVMKALAKNREERYQTIKDLAIDLRRLKQRLEVEAEIERSAQPDASSWTTGGRDSAQAITATAKEPSSSSGRKRSRKAIDSLAVLPFANATADPNAEYLSDGITEDLINSLSQLPKLRVMARSTVFRYKGKEVDPIAVGRSLGVRAVCTGRVLQLGESLVIRTELVDVESETHLWGEQYKRNAADILAVQEEISREISEKMRFKLTRAERKQILKQYTDNTEAYHFYLQGRFHQNKWTAEGIKKSIELFDQAIAVDPNYARAYAGLADSYASLGIGDALAMSPMETAPRARAAALKALELDGTLAEAHTSLGLIKLNFDWDWKAAETEFNSALKLNPNYAPAYHWYSHYLIAMGRMDESLVISKHALELDPLNLEINAHLCWHYYFARDYDKAIEQAQKTLEMDAGFIEAYFFLGWAQERKQNYDEVIATFQRARQLEERPEISLTWLGRAYALSGNKNEALKLLDELKEQAKRRYMSAYNMALIYLGLGETDAVFECLREACAQRSAWMVYAKVNPIFDSLRSDPRFTDLLRDIGLAP